MTSAAPAIVQSVDGDGIVSLTDSAETILTGVRLYGKTVQTGTPTPETPVPLINAGKDDIIRFYVRGKNLMPSFVGGSGGVASGATVTRNADGTVTLDGTATASGYIYLTTYSSSYDKGIRLPAGTYRVTNGHTGTFDGVSQNITYRVGVYRDGKTIGGTNTFPGNLTIEDGDLLECYIRTKEGETYNNLTFKPMICAAGAFTDDYEPYKDGGQGLVVVTDEAGIPGIPVTSGGNYTDANGQQWICDEIDFVRKVYVKRLHALTLDGSQSMRWYADERMPFGGVMQLILSSSYYVAIPHRNKTISDRFVNKNNVAASFSHGVFGVTASGQSMFFGIEGVADADTANAWFSANPTTILYALATPIETPLPPEQIDSTTLTVQYLNTTVYNNVDAGMRIDYIVDTQAWTNNNIQGSIDSSAAPPIVATVSGNVLSVSDSAERPLAGLHLYGKTTQDGTPTPEAPVELVNAGADGDVSVMLAGKNLFQDRRTSKADYTSNGITFVTNADGTFTANGTNDTTARSSMTLTTGSRWLYLPAATYTVSSGLPNGDGYFQLSYNDTMDSTGSTAVYVYATPKTFTIDKPKYAWMALNVAAGKTVENLVFKPQIEVGAVATEYEPYQEYQTMTAETPNGLPGLPVSSGGNYIDGNGQRWVCDEIDFTRKVYVQRIKRVTLSEMTGGHNGTNYYFTSVTDKKPGSANLLCSHFSAGPRSGAQYCCGNEKDPYVFLYGSPYTTLADLKAAYGDAKFLYELATSIETPLSPKVLAAFAALKSQYPHTTVFNDSDAGMALSYIADTKIYIDNKFAALAAALLDQ